MMKKGWMVVAMVLMATLAGAFELTVDKVPLTTIVIPADAPETVKLAARDLRDFIAKCNGTELAVAEQSSAEQGNIFVSGHEEMLEGVPAQGFRITSKDGNLYIVGHDYKGKVVYGLRNPWNFNEVYSPALKIGAFGACGSLHGVYYFLEKFGGVRFFWPGDVGTVIPEKHDIVLTDVSEMQYPKFHYRHPWLCNFDQVTDDVLWYKRVGFGGDAPVQIIDYFMVITNELKDTHPEYFALVDGVRDFDDKCAIRGGGHLCFNAPGVKEAVADIIIQYFKENPEQNTFPLTPGDGLRRCCECPLCKAEYENEPEGTGHFSNHIWRFVNDVAGLVEKECPGKIVGCLGYEGYRDAPTKIDHLNSNVGVMLCYDRSQMASPNYEQTMHATVDAWHKKLDHSLYSWNWYLQGWLPWRQFPVVFVRTVQRDIQYMLKNGFAGEFIEAESFMGNEPHKYNYPGTLHLNLYVTGKLYWNPDLDLKALLEDYYTSFYGPAAPEMRQFFEIAADRWEIGNANASETTGVQASVKPDTIFDNECLDKLWELLETSLAKVPADSPYAARLKTIQEEFGHARSSLIAMLRTEKPEMKALCTDEPIEIDGILDEETWSRGEGAYMVKKNGEPAPVNTQFYCRQDDQNLYFAFIMGEKKLDKLYVGHPDMAKDVWQDDCVEVFITMGDEGKGCIQYDVNSDGTMMVYFNSDDGYGADVTASSKAVASAGRGINRWTVEIAIPLKELKLNPGENPKVNFFRSRVVDESQSYTTWSPSFTEKNYIPEYFGTLILD